jgi:hypothetical protein
MTHCKGYHKESFLLTVGSVRRVKRFIADGRPFADEEVETGVRKLLRQQPKDFYAAGFNALVRRWDKCINVGGGYVEKFFFLQVRISHCVLYPFVACLLTVPRITRVRTN